MSQADMQWERRWEKRIPRIALLIYAILGWVKLTIWALAGVWEQGRHLLTVIGGK